MIYYAHSKRIYNTDRERKERQFLERKFNILCPNRDLGELGDIRPYLKRVKECSQIICSEYKNKIGRGVFDEISYALRLKKPVFVLRKNRIIPVKSVEVVDDLDFVLYGKINA